jgi:hypothetical protein
MDSSAADPASSDPSITPDQMRARLRNTRDQIKEKILSQRTMLESAAE